MKILDLSFGQIAACFGVFVLAYLLADVIVKMIYKNNDKSEKSKGGDK
ncbi:MAG: hypothetical protein NC253_01415 [Ruminococcus sp.]|nr:hypothetical protein [Ruminococcus sp.]MCM1380916.1 hypothetical protein [Muribaculaceae bacterium]MCM1480362.1 hypothetical protein [Muribaculaceae bacterium]